MKLIKRFFWFVIILVLLLCAGVTVCAFNPALTSALTEKIGALELGSKQPTSDEGEVASLGADPAEVVDFVELPDADDIGRLFHTKNADGLPAVEEYVAPQEEDVKPPQIVGDRLGYEPVTESGQEIGEELANAIWKDVDTGNTGADYSFDTLIYPYYAMLGDAEQELYRQIYANAWDLKSSFTPAVEIDVERVKTVFEAVYNDHPELFWLETGYSCQYLKNGRCVEITLKYNRTVNNLENATVEFEQAAEAILGEARGLDGDYEKEKYVHNALISQAEYDTSASMSQSAYSALVNKRSVCAGYSRAYQYLLQRLGIPCYYCTGYSGGEHAWNIVQLSDGYYNVDTTWDDTTPPTYDYFNKTDQDYASTHMRKGLSVNLPACLGNAYRNLESGQPVKVKPTGQKEETEEPVEDGVEAGDEPAEEPVYINDNPQKPLSVERKPSNESTATQSDTTFELTDYYADCLAQMIEVGAGQKQFVNVIPQALWDAVERSYSDGSYKTGYVNAGLEKLGMSNFAIQLQVQRIGDGYYRLYHNISTW
ncbi:MAG: hypothetical protein IJ833_02095 [Lachnospiraceae bacterium]|nr:hypothetical protein [Lachnospiraceae bacterium]